MPLPLLPAQSEVLLSSVLSLFYISNYTTIKLITPVCYSVYFPINGSHLKRNQRVILWKKNSLENGRTNVLLWSKFKKLPIIKLNFCFLQASLRNKTWGSLAVWPKMFGVIRQLKKIIRQLWQKVGLGILLRLPTGPGHLVSVFNWYRLRWLGKVRLRWFYTTAIKHILQQRQSWLNTRIT